MKPCEICGAQVLDALVCTGCTRRLDLALGDVPALTVDLETVLAKLTVYTQRTGRVTGSRYPPLPFDTHAGQTRTRLHAVLTSWVRIVNTERHNGNRPLPMDRSSSCAGWLLYETEWIRHQQWASEAIGNITGVIGDIRYILDAPPNRATIHIGQCPHCDGQINAYIPRDTETPTTITCTTTTHAWEPGHWQLLGRTLEATA